MSEFVRLFVCLSVRLSVTPVSHAYTVEDIEILFVPYDWGIFYFLEAKFRYPEFRGVFPTSTLPCRQRTRSG